MRVRLVVLVLLVVAPVAAASSISAEASGRAAPPLSFVSPLLNGDFTITTLHSFPIGDGEDDLTRWAFDLTAAPGFAAFSTTAPLTLANLTLTLTPGDGLVASDEVSIEGLDPIRDPAFPFLSVGVTTTVTVDLLAYYSSEDILGEFVAGAGLLPMLYQDDATLSYARLELASIPEPGTFVLMPLGVALLAVVWRRRSRRVP